MSDFPTLTLNTATDAQRAPLETANAAFGFVPNLIGNMAMSPELAEAYLSIGGLFAKTSFDETERQVVLLAISRFHECTYCVSAHSAIAQMGKVPNDVIDAIRSDHPIANGKLETLRRFATRVVESRGWPTREELDHFYSAGYGQQQVLEVVLAAAYKTMSNYTNHITSTKLDDVFAGQSWEIP